MAKIAPGPAEQTKDDGGALMGSIYMMSPEQLEGRPLDARSDLYSLGCVAYFALTACYPFSGKTVVEVITAHLHGRHTPLEQMRPDLPKALCEWVNGLMAVYPEDRPATAATALAQLRGVLDPVQATPVVVTAPRPVGFDEPEARSWNFRLPRIRFADLGVAAFLIAIGTFCYFRLAAPPRSVDAVPTLAPAERQAVLARLGQPVIIEGVVKEIATGKGGLRHLRFVEAGEKDLVLAFYSMENPVEQVRQMSEFVGRKVRVRGTVSQREGVPMIFIDSFSQLETL
jgi:hypothetical protein